MTLILYLGMGQTSIFMNSNFVIFSSCSNFSKFGVFESSKSSRTTIVKENIIVYEYFMTNCKLLTTKVVQTIRLDYYVLC